MGAYTVRYRLVFILSCLCLLGCEEEPTMQRNPEPPGSPRPVEPAVPDEASESQPAAESKGPAPTEPAPKKESLAPAEPKPEKPIAKKDDSGRKVDHLAAAPRPKTLAYTNGSALGGSKATRLIQIFRPTATVPPKTTIQITSPTPNEVLRRATLKLQVRLTGFEPYKTDSGEGQWLRVVVDNERTRNWYDPDERAFKLSGLAPGWHTVRVYAIDTDGECIKDEQAFDAINFYVRTNRDAPNPLDFSRPIVTYNAPIGTYSGAASALIPLDFHLANAQLRGDGYRVRVKVGALPAFDVTAWTTAYLEDLPVGTHDISLTLHGPDGNVVTHPWNPVERQFTVSK